ncbi:MAG: EamA family transporter [Nitrospinota bacterium]|nr:EamA family transporter [Nitrospinota bacterium]
MLIVDLAFLFALSASFSYALCDMGIRSGLQYTNAFIGSTIVLTSSLIIYLAFILFFQSTFPNLGIHYFWIIFAGACNPGLFLIFYLTGISKIGVARAAPIKGSSPILGTLLGILILSEEPTWKNLAGIAIVFSGITLISFEKIEGGWKKIHIVWPIASAVVASFAAVFWRKGLQEFPDTTVGTTIGTLVGLMIVGTYTVFTTKNFSEANLKKSLKPFLFAGLVMASGFYCYTKSMQLGEVYRMLPIVQTSPIFTVTLAFLIMRKIEKLTWRVPAGCLMTVGGALLVNLRW